VARIKGIGSGPRQSRGSTDSSEETRGADAAGNQPEGDAFSPVRSGERRVRLRGPSPTPGPAPEADQALEGDVGALRAGANAQGLPRRKSRAGAEEGEPPPKPAWVQRREQRVADFKQGVLEGVGKAGDRLAQRIGGDDYTSTLDRDGDKIRIEPERVAEGNRDKPSMIFVNGAGSNLEHASDAAQRFANEMNSDVDLIYNATEIRQYEGKPVAQLGAMVADWGKDIEQLKDDYHDRGSNPAADAVSDEVVERLRRGEEVQLAGFSQGNAIIARGLRQARDVRLEELTQASGGDAALAQQKLEQEFAGVRVVNMSGPAQYGDYPVELPQENYTHAEMKRDPAYTVLGEGADAYRDQEFDQRADSASFDLALKARWHDLDKVLGKDGDRLRGFFDRE